MHDPKDVIATRDLLCVCLCRPGSTIVYAEARFADSAGKSYSDPTVAAQTKTQISNLFKNDLKATSVATESKSDADDVKDSDIVQRSINCMSVDSHQCSETIVSRTGSCISMKDRQSLVGKRHQFGVWQDCRVVIYRPDRVVPSNAPTDEVFDARFRANCNRFGIATGPSSSVWLSIGF